MTNKVLAAGFVALPLVWSAAVVTGVTGLAGCAGQRGATQQAMARARTSQAEGSKVYSENCTICHGDVGQGGPGAPPVMGGSALPVKVRIRRDHKIDSLKADDARRKQYEDSKVAGSGEREAPADERFAGSRAVLVGSFFRSGCPWLEGARWRIEREKRGISGERTLKPALRSMQSLCKYEGHPLLQFVALTEGGPIDSSTAPSSGVFSEARLGGVG